MIEQYLYYMLKHCFLYDSFWGLFSYLNMTLLENLTKIYDNGIMVVIIGMSRGCNWLIGRNLTMKKILILLLIILCSVSFIGCSKNKAEAEFKGIITEINGQYAIISADEGEEIRGSGELVEVDLSKNEEVEFKIGDRVKVGYDGAVQEKYPLGITTIYVELLENE